MKKFIAHLFVFTFINVKMITSIPDQAMDRFIVGQLYSNKYSYQYIESVPIYQRYLTPYYDNYSWGYYIHMDRSKTPSVGLVFVF